MFLAFAESAFRIQASFRAQLWAMLFGTAINVFARVSIWLSVFGHQTTVSGVELPQMVTYAIVATTLLSTWDASQMVRDIGADIRSGDIVNQLLRPYNYPASLFARQFGVRSFDMLAIGLPVIAFTGIFYGLQPPATAGHALLFLLYVALSLFILFALATIFGLLCFWVLDALALDWLLSGMLALLSGRLVPLWFFPASLAEIARFLPFSWITFYPMATYLGQMDLPTSGLYLLFGLGWAIVLVGIIGLLWSRARYRLMVQGG